MPSTAPIRASWRRARGYPGLEIIAKLATLLEVEPAGLLRVRLPKGKCSELCAITLSRTFLAVRRPRNNSAPARIVNVSSAGQQPLDFGDVMLTRGYSGRRAYCQSKLAQIMFTINLVAALKGTGVTVTCLRRTR